MVATLLLGFIAELVFDAAASMRRSFGNEMDRYFEARHFRPARPKPASTR